MEVDPTTQTELDAQVLRVLLAHLAKRSDVQNIDLMNLAGFCRNCLGKWYAVAARERGLEISKEQAMERIYGMPYAQWKEQYQAEATPGQLAALRDVMADPNLTS
jgi:hypothetical protein